jgi:hypothetical protein
MKFLSLLSLATACVATSVVAQSELFNAEERAQGEASIRAAAAFFASSLREPSSATFRNVFIGKRPPPTKTLKIIVCGEINARNGFGGYTGFQHFIVSGGSVYTGRIAGLSVREACFDNRVFDTRDYSPELTAAFQESL